MQLFGQTDVCKPLMEGPGRPGICLILYYCIYLQIRSYKSEQTLGKCYIFFARILSSCRLSQLS